MPNNDVKIDHEAALNAAKLLCDFFTFANSERGEARQRNLARAYLDAMARLDEATELLRDAIDQLERPDEMAQVVREEASAFLAKHRKTGANDGK